MSIQLVFCIVVFNFNLIKLFDLHERVLPADCFINGRKSIRVNYHTHSSEPISWVDCTVDCTLIVLSEINDLVDQSIRLCQDWASNESVCWSLRIVPDGFYLLLQLNFEFGRFLVLRYMIT